jgi:hypothetical protein
MLVECLLFRHLAANDYRQHDVQQLSFLCCRFHECSAAMLADLDQISELLPSAQISRASWGQRWGQLAFVSIASHSEVRFPPPPPTSINIQQGRWILRETRRTIFLGPELQGLE